MPLGSLLEGPGQQHTVGGRNNACAVLLLICILHLFPCGVSLSPSLQKAQHLAQLGVPLAERVLLPHILEITKSLYAGLAWGGTGREVRRRAV